MKRLISVVMILCLLTAAVPLSVSAAGTVTEVTDYAYIKMVSGAKGNTVAYTAYNDSRVLMLGTLDASGELTRETYTAEGWKALFEESLWNITAVHGNAADQCPYAYTHADNTVCPYTQVACVTMTHAVSGATLERVYVSSSDSTMLPEGSIHFCFGRYGYKAPLTLKWDESERYMALKGDNGLWGVYDAQACSMVTEYVYSNMSIPYGQYVKVFDGTAWGRLDLSGQCQTKYYYETEDSFSIREEVRAVEGGWRVFSKDNEPISPLIEGAYTSMEYHAGAALVTAVTEDGATSLIDVTGDVVKTYDASYTVRYLQDTLYAVEHYADNRALIGTALLDADNVPTPRDTIALGDVNFDGDFNTSDVRMILLCAVNDTVITERQMWAADMDADGLITTTDARLLLNQIIR